MLRQRAPDEFGVGDVAMNEDVVGIVRHFGQRGGIAGISQLVEIDDAATLPDQMAHDGRTDETGAAGDENGIHLLSPDR